MNDLYRTMGQRIGKLRRKRNITQEAMAEQLDVTVKHVSAVERGLSSYSLDKLVLVSHLLNCTMDFLFFGYESQNLLSQLPSNIVSILDSQDTYEVSLLLDYLNLYCKLRDLGDRIDGNE